MRGHNANSSSVSVRLKDGARGSGVIDTGRYTPPEPWRRSDRIAVWASGDVVVEGGRLEDARNALVHSPGVAVGTDVRIGSHVIGNAIGTAFDTTAVGASGAVGSRYFSDSVYGSFSTSENTFLDVGVGAAVSDLSSDRCVGCGTDRRHRTADQVFAGARYSGRLEGEGIALRPYGEARVSRSAYHDSAEAGTAGARHGQSSVRATDLTIGLSGESTLESPAGRLRPRAGLKVSRSYTRTSGGAIVSTGTDGEQSYSVPATLDGRDSFAIGTGLGWSVGSRTSVDAEYRLNSDVTDFDPHQSIRARLKVRF